MEEISDEEFTKELRIFWQNNVSARELVGLMIQDYFEGNRAEKIINKLQKEEIK